MIEIRIENLDVVRRAMEQAADQVPYAASRAINAVAFQARTGLQDEMRTRFDRPTPWLLRQLRVKKSTKRDLSAIIGSPQSVKGGVGVLDKILAPHIHGMRRVPKPVEQSLAAAGMLPSGWVAVPTSYAKLNQYGNLSRANWRRIVAASRAGVKSRWFAAIPGAPATRHLRLGIYERYGGKRARKIRPIILFYRAAEYQQMLSWEQTARQIIQGNFSAEFESAFEQALASRRGNGNG